MCLHNRVLMYVCMRDARACVHDCVRVCENACIHAARGCVCASVCVSVRLPVIVLVLVFERTSARDHVRVCLQVFTRPCDRRGQPNNYPDKTTCRDTPILHTSTVAERRKQRNEK